MIEQIFGSAFQAVGFLLFNFAGTGFIAIAAGKWILKRVDTALDAYAGERGKLSARLHSLEAIVKETRANEQAKLEARFDNLDRSVEETRRLATASETVKHSLSHQAWLREKRLEAYVNILAALQSYCNACEAIANAEKRFTNAVDSNWNSDLISKLREEHSTKAATLDVARNDLLRFHMNSILVADGEPLLMLNELRPTDPKNPEEFYDEAVRVARFMANLMKSAGASLAHPGGTNDLP